MMFMFSALFLFSSCSNDQGTSNISNVELREEMRNFVIGISKYSKAQNPNFLIVPQNGIELITKMARKMVPFTLPISMLSMHMGRKIYFLAMTMIT